jgi:1-acyl-sn-glycerol-3-phosphate acyltransferase
LITLLVSPFVAGRWRPVRVGWMVTTYMLVEAGALISMFAMWLASGFGWQIRRPMFQRAHYRLCGLALRILYRQARWVLRLTVDIAGASPDLLPPGRPLLVFCRHAGPGDSFLLAHALINWYDRDPRIVLKSTLQWDPTIDVLLNRLPNRFIVPGSGEAAERQIAELATDLDENDALVIFPEGGNFTPERWRRAIARLRRLGLYAMARRAERMRNVLPPRPGGVLAALEASTRADVVLVAHTGVDHLRTAGDVWRALPMDKTIVMQWWLEAELDVPALPDERIDWLFRWWARIDEWIVENRSIPEPLSS